MPAFTPPVFNILVDVWYHPRVPSDGLPDVADQPAQFYVTPKGQYESEPFPASTFTIPLYLRLPWADASVWRQAWVVEIPESSGLYYHASFKERVHLGFPNQYLLILLNQCDADGNEEFHDMFGGGGGSHSAAGAATLDLVLTPVGAGTGLHFHTATGAPTITVELTGSGAASH